MNSIIDYNNISSTSLGVSYYWKGNRKWNVPSSSSSSSYSSIILVVLFVLSRSIIVSSSIIAFDVPVQGDGAFQLQCDDTAPSYCDVKQQFDWSVKRGTSKGTCGTGQCYWETSNPSSTLAMGDCASSEMCYVYCDVECTCTLGNKGSGFFVANGTNCNILENPPTEAPTGHPDERIIYDLTIGYSSIFYDTARITCGDNDGVPAGTQCVVHDGLEENIRLTYSNFRQIVPRDDNDNYKNEPYRLYQVIDDEQPARMTASPCSSSSSSAGGDQACTIACDPICSCSLIRDSSVVGSCIVPTNSPTMVPTTMVPTFFYIPTTPVLPTNSEDTDGNNGSDDVIGGAGNGDGKGGGGGGGGSGSNAVATSPSFRIVWMVLGWVWMIIMT